MGPTGIAKIVNFLAKTIKKFHNGNIRHQSFILIVYLMLFIIFLYLQNNHINNNINQTLLGFVFIFTQSKKNMSIVIKNRNVLIIYIINMF